MQDNALGVVKHRHVDNDTAGEGHVLKIRIQGDVIAERTDAMREPVLCPWKEFTVCGDGVHLLQRSGLVLVMTTRL